MFFKKPKQKKLNAFDLGWRLFLLREGIQEQRYFLSTLAKKHSTEEVVEHTEQTYNYIKENNVKIDAVICDCTYGVLDITFDGHHMSLLDNVSHREKLMELGAIKKDTPWVVTHFSHNGLNKNGKAVFESV